MKISLHNISHIFAKCIIFDAFPFGLPTGCQKVLMHPILHDKMYRLVLKRVLQVKKKWLTHGLQTCVFSGLLYQSGQIDESGSQIRLPDVAVLPTMLYGCNVLNLNFKLDFNSNLTITV